ncbi:MAG: anthranilate phosphoribosyltransferase [Deltaproteobacteria bacterium]|nr:anthranilate phosphoribosyltransferase [Deltaproteobacteria bacterium]
MRTPQEVIRHVSAGKDLTQDQAAVVMEGIMTGEWTPAQIGAYLTALHMKGETKDEITGSAYVMREKAFHLEVKRRPLVDIVGSGGDALGTLNVSTLSGLICAGAGVSVAKHGNRAMTGMCGSADILEGLGLTLNISPADAVHGVDVNGFTFLFAPHFHQSMKHAVGPRKDIGIPSIFNHLGPLTNPLRAERYVLGVNRRENTVRFTEVLAGLGCQHSLVVHGADGMDEITLTGPSTVVEQREGKTSQYEIKPEDFGMKRVELQALKLPDKATAILTARSVLEGKGPAHQENLVLMNAGAGIYVGGKAPSLAEGIGVARETLKSGAALRVLERVVAYTQERKLETP